MAGSVNKVTLLGNLGVDPEVRRTQSGSPVVSFSLATSESWRDRASGEKREKTDWHNVVIWNEGLCKVAEQYLRKGSKVYIEGKLQTRKWQDQSGNDRYTTEIVLQFNATLVMLSGRDDGGGSRGRDDRERDSRGEYDAGGQSRSGSAGGRGNQSYGGGSYARDMDDDIPFSPEWR